MDSKAEYSPQSALYPRLYPATAAPIPIYPGVAAPLVEAPRELWFTIAKYYILIVNCIACALTAFLAVIVAILSLLALFTGLFGVFFLTLILAALIVLISLYFYLVPIKGVIRGLPVRLLVHGVLCGIGLLSALSSLAFGTGTIVSTGDSKIDEFVKDYTSTSSVYIRLIFDILEMVACFSMARNLRKRAEYASLTSNA